MNLDNINTIYQGTSGVTEIYQGSTLVWPLSALTVIYYTTSDESLLYPHDPSHDSYPDYWDVLLVSNTYENGVGKMVFDAPVRRIPKIAFAGKILLTSMQLPKCVNEIAFEAFDDCENLTGFTVPDSVTELGESVFETPASSYKSLTYIKFSDSLTEIPARTCYANWDLTDVILPSGVTEIGDQAFYACRSLTGITFPDSLKIIRFDAFGDCENLASLTIPSGVTLIEDSAFHNCSITTIYAYPTTAPAFTGPHTFQFLPNIGALHYPSGSDYSTWTEQLPAGWVFRADL